MRTEFHVHTCASKDSILTWPFILAAAKVRHIDCIAVTDHNEIKNALRYRKILSRFGIKVIPGEEVFSKEGEIIGLFLEKRIEPGLSPEETVKRIREQGGVTYVPHPYDEKRAKTVLKPDALSRISQDVDLIEMHNGRNISASFGIKQKKIADEYGIVKVVGSDAHTFYELGRNVCVCDDLNKDNIKDELTKATFIKKPCIPFSHKHTKVVKALKLLFGGKSDELRGIIRKRRKRKMQDTQ